MKERELIKLELIKHTKHEFVKTLPERVLHLLWAEFSRIQAANFLCVKGGFGESVCRFDKWVMSGDDEDAWA